MSTYRGFGGAGFKTPSKSANLRTPTTKGSSFQTPTSKGRSLPQKPRGLFVNGVWQCDCNTRLPAVHFQTKKKSENQGKWFFACQRKKEDKENCKFFLWADDAKPRELKALQNNSRSEPEPEAMQTPVDTPSRPLKTVNFADRLLQTAPNPSKKRGRNMMMDDGDELGLDAADFDDEPQLMEEINTPSKKAARTETFTTPRRKLPWNSNTEALPTPSKTGKEETQSSQTLSSDSSIHDTPMPSRFTDMGTHGSRDNLVDDVFDLLNKNSVRLDDNTSSALRTLLGKHARKAEGNNKGKEVLRLRVKAEEARNVELKAMVEHLKWEKEHGSDV